MTFTKKTFIIAEALFLFLGVLFLSLLAMEYNDNFVVLENLHKKEFSLKKEHAFDLPVEVKKVYDKIFISSYDSNNIIPHLQRKIRDLALPRDVLISEIKIKKIENGVFSFVVKMTSKDDRGFYSLIHDVENLNDAFVVSLNLILQKRSKITGEYHFEVHTKP